MPVFATYEHNFGLVIPMKTDIFWEQQTNGVCCNHVQIEGVYLPLKEPRVYNQRTKRWRDLLDELTQANYRYNHEGVARLWEIIKKVMAEDFEYETALPPQGQPSSEEGLQWIKITKNQSEFNWNDFGSLVGKTVALIYPNCD